MTDWTAFALGLAVGVVAVWGALRPRWRRVAAVSTIDPKTSLLTSAAWVDRARRELDRATRAAAPTAVLLLDVDAFKQINDRRGHLAGDAVLAKLAATLVRELRSYDVVGRFGGDEFVVLLPRTSCAPAEAVADRVRAAVARVDGGDVLTVSIGVASGCATVEELIAAADGAMYDAKRAGGDQVRVAAGQPRSTSSSR